MDPIVKSLASTVEAKFNSLASAKEPPTPMQILGLSEELRELASYKPHLVLSVTQKLRCTKCKKSPANLQQLPCFHSICPSCLSTQVEIALKHEGREDLLKETICPKCEEIIPEELVRSVIPPENLQKIFQGHGIECDLCKGGHHHTDVFILSCGHKFGKRCLLDYLEHQINRGMVTEEFICCQKVGCGKPLNGYEIVKMLPEKSEEKLTKFRMKVAAPLNNEVIRFCQKCDDPQWLDISETIFYCAKCDLKRCVRCGSEPHPGLTCAEDMAKRSGNNDEMEKQMAKNGMKYCPSCKGMMLKTHGCNFVYCTTSECQSKKYMCNHCGMKLHQRDHWSHFFFNPYGAFCKLKC